MKLEPIGRVEDPTTLDLDPIIVPIVGYTENRKEVVEEFKFRPVQPAGATLDVLRAADTEGRAPIGLVMSYLEEALTLDDRERWNEFLHRADVFIEQTVLIQLYQRLTEVYAERPTKPSSGSAGGGSTTRRTSRAGARAKGSASTK